jgi:GH35 family endo-1,4-beta-xylanase
MMTAINLNINFKPCTMNYIGKFNPVLFRSIFLYLMLLIFPNISTYSGTLVTSAGAETGQLSGAAFVATSIAGYTGTGYVTNLRNNDDRVTVTVTVPASDFYLVTVRYYGNQRKYQDIGINDGGFSPVEFPASNTWAYTNAGKYFFNEGENTITIRSNWGWTEIDEFRVYTTTVNYYDDITTGLVNVNASSAAVSLYNYLYSHYGKRIISGQTDGQYYHEIKELTGQSPMYKVWDFQRYTEGYPYLWKDGGHTFGTDPGIQNTEKAIAWYNDTGKKGIVGFQWHWHSPKGGAVSTNTFYTNYTSFDVREAVKEGTPEYEMIIRDIDAIAIELKKFQEANVPVLWRPLHEAGGGWFWWGAHGPEPCLKLYDIIFSRLTGLHQLNNLIWVWSTPETDWYPGNDKVDIVGHDSYPGLYNYSAQKNSFDIHHDLTGGKKIVAMSENGPIPCVDTSLDYDAPWSFFMSWYDLVFKQNSEEHIIDVYSNPRVLTLEKDLFPRIVSTTDNSVCGTGSVTLEAVSNSGLVKWYDSPEGGELLHTGTTFITPVISSSATYYSAALNNDETTDIKRIAVTARISEPIDPSVIDGPSEVYRGSSEIKYSLPADDNVDAYTWTLPEGAVAAGSTSSNTIWVNFTSDAQSGVVMARGKNACGEGPENTFDVSVVSPPVNMPPSCVITYPHSNAYYQEGTSMMIRVFSTGFGGTLDGKSISNVEFFADGEKIHETSEHVSHTWSFLWEDLQKGTYRITARATDDSGVTFTSAGVFVTVGSKEAIRKGLSAGKGKYLGNIYPLGGVRNDFSEYWNGVTAENGNKWGVIEGTRDVMNWTNADAAYKYAFYNNFMYRYHAIAWGSQYPEWITTLEPDEFRQELEEYMAAVAERYPMLDQIDVLNEQLRNHAGGTGYFRDALGGEGETGYDWQIWIFEKAREYFPNSKLILNDYGLENDVTAINEMLGLVEVLRDRGLIDGFGTQAHYFNLDQMVYQASTLRSRLNLMASSGVPIYVTELDLRGNMGNESSQLLSYERIFPVYWEHPAVAGITLWGYVEGETWGSGTGIINNDGSKKAAMVWLEEYMAGLPEMGYPHDGIEPVLDDNMLINGEFDSGTIGWDIQNNSGASGTMEVVTDAEMSGPNALKICPVNPGTSNWHIQVRQSVPVEAGREYAISFLAKTDAPRVLDVAIQRDQSPWTTWFQQTRNINSSVQEFSFLFAPTVSDATARLKFYVGNNSTCVYIDNVRYVDITEPYIPDLPEIPDFAPPNAEWYYTELHAGSGDISYLKISSEKDTIVGGKDCRILGKYGNLSYTGRPDREFMYQEDSVVYFWDDTFNEFQVLYDLTKKEGEHWIIRLLDTHNNDKMDTLKVIVDEVSKIEINEIELKELHVTYHVISSPGSQPYSSRIIQGIGDIHYMFNYSPFQTLQSDVNYSGGLRCYEDTEIGHYSTGITESCDFVLIETGIDQVTGNTEILVFPNPNYGQVQILTGTEKEYNYRITGITGMVHKRGNFTGNVQLDISQLPEGIYIIRISDNNNRRSTEKKIIKY